MFKSLKVGLALATVLAMQAVATAAVITRPFGTLGVVTGITDLNVDGTLYDVSFVILSNGVSPTFNNVFGVGEPPPTVPAFYNNRVGAQRAADAIAAAIPSFASGAYFSAFQDGIGPPTFGNIASAVYIPYRTIGDQPPSIQFSYVSVRTSSFTGGGWQRSTEAWDARTTPGFSFAIFKPAGGNSVVPEPASVAVWSLCGLIGCATRRRMSIKKSAA